MVFIQFKCCYNIVLYDESVMWYVDNTDEKILMYHNNKWDFTWSKQEANIQTGLSHLGRAYLCVWEKLNVLFLKPETTKMYLRR